jgi:putative acetyltransferase
VTSQWGTLGADSPAISLFTPSGEDQLTHIYALFTEYCESLSVDLCFQNFAEELRTLPGEYNGPRGALLAVRVSDEIVGCCAMRPLDTVDYANACELKRLYVRPAFRGMGLGRLLAEGILEAARLADYACVVLDTLDDMESARALYEGLGFREIPPYYFNPIAGSHYLKADL